MFCTSSVLNNLYGRRVARTMYMINRIHASMLLFMQRQPNDDGLGMFEVGLFLTDPQQVLPSLGSRHQSLQGWGVYLGIIKDVES